MPNTQPTPSPGFTFPNPPVPDPNKPLLAWHNDPGLKLATVARMREHRDLDQLVRGVYVTPAYLLEPDAGVPFKGCFLGCLVIETAAAHENQPLEAIVEKRHLFDWYAWAAGLFGIDGDVAWLIEAVFEELPLQAAREFAVEVLEAIPVGGRLDFVRESVGAPGPGQNGPWIFGRADEAAERLLYELRTAPVAELSP